MRFDQQKKANIGIDIAPLVDVVFLLVIFFAVSTTFLESGGLQLQLPSSSSSTPRENKTLIVSLDAEGQLEFEGEIVEADVLTERLRAALENNDQKNVVLRADRRTEHGKVVRLMDVIREAGAEGLTVDAQSASQGE